MNKINIDAFHAAKVVFAELTKQRAAALELHRVTDQKRNGNYNSQFWDVVSTYDADLDKKLSRECAQLRFSLEHLNKAFFNLTVMLKASAMCVLNEQVKGTAIRYVSATTVLNELLTGVALAEDNVFVVGDYRKYGLIAETCFEELNASYNACKGFFSI